MVEKLLSEWLDGLKAEVNKTVNLRNTFTMKTVAKPDEESVFLLIAPHRCFKNSLKPYPDGEFFVSSDGETPLAKYRVRYTDKPTEKALDVVLMNPTAFTEEDARNALPKIIPILQRMAEADWEGDTLPTQQPPHHEKDKLVSIIPKSAVPAKGEFTLGVHAPFVTEVLGKFFCNVGMEKTEVLRRLKVLERAAMGGRREYIAKLDLVRQLIAYGLIFRVREGKVEFLVYKRNKHNGEKQMTSVFSIAIGGHAEPLPDFVDYMAYDEKDPGLEGRTLQSADLFNTNVMDLHATADMSYQREGPEEVTITSNGKDVTQAVIQTGTPVGFVCDSSDVQGFVGNSHFGIVYAAEAPADATFVMNEKNLDEVCWLDHETLVDLVFARAFVKGDANLQFPYGDVMLDAPVALRDKAVLDAPEYQQFLESDFEPWSQYIIHSLHNLVERILGRPQAV